MGDCGADCDAAIVNGGIRRRTLSAIVAEPGCEGMALAGEGCAGRGLSRAGIAAAFGGARDALPPASAAGVERPFAEGARSAARLPVRGRPPCGEPCRVACRNRRDPFESSVADRPHLADRLPLIRGPAERHKR